MAGAGAGKTTLLSRRFLHHVQVEGLSPLAVVAVTFTELAATELRARVRALVQAQPGATPDTLGALEAAPICTLHALAARICREHPDAAEVPRGFRVLDEREGRLWQAEQLDAAIARLPARSFEGLAWSHMRQALEELGREPHLAAQALAAPLPEPTELAAWLRDAALADCLADPTWQHAVESLRAIAFPPEARIEALRAQTLQAVTLLEAAAAGAADPAAACAAMSGLALRGKLGWPGRDSEVEALKEAIRVVREALKALEPEVSVQPGPADQAWPAVQPLLREAWEQVQAQLAVAKRQARCLDYADLELGALRALRQPEVRAFYQARWKAFIVDEFQDTNPTQAELLTWLTADARLTIVGDDKQAIFGFRRADVSVFHRFREAIAARGEERSLLTSYRTHVPLVAVLNRVCAPLLGALHRDMDARRAAPADGPHLTAAWLDVDPHDRRVTSGDRQRAEAFDVAERIARDLAEGRPVHDRRTGAIRPLAPTDVAVLARTWAALPAFEEALRARGIAAVQTKGGDLFDTQEALDGLSLLQWLADPADALSLVAVLRSPMGHVPDGALAELAATLGDTRDWSAALAEASQPDIRHAAQWLTALRAARRGDAPSDLLVRADHLSGYTAVLAHLPGAARRLADWQGLVTLVREFERGGQDLESVVLRLRRLRASGVSFERPALETGEAVSLMTLHASKGLEWPLVALVDLARRPPVHTPTVRADAQLGVALRIVASASSEEAPPPLLYRWLAREQALLERAERRRLLYVGMTRARDHLMLSAAARAGGWLDDLAPALASAGIVPTWVPFAPPPEAPSPPRASAITRAADWALGPGAPPIRFDPAAWGQAWRADDEALDRLS